MLIDALTLLLKRNQGREKLFRAPIKVIRQSWVHFVPKSPTFVPPIYRRDKLLRRLAFSNPLADCLALQLPLP